MASAICAVQDTSVFFPRCGNEIPAGAFSASGKDASNDLMKGFGMSDLNGPTVSRDYAAATNAPKAADDAHTILINKVS
jgi:hypothetical protein